MVYDFFEVEKEVRVLFLKNILFVHCLPTMAIM